MPYDIDRDSDLVLPFPYTKEHIKVFDLLMKNKAFNTDCFDQTTLMGRALSDLCQILKNLNIDAFKTHATTTDSYVRGPMCDLEMHLADQFQNLTARVSLLDSYINDVAKIERLTGYNDITQTLNNADPFLTPQDPIHTVVLPGNYHITPSANLSNLPGPYDLTPGSVCNFGSRGFDSFTNGNPVTPTGGGSAAFMMASVSPLAMLRPSLSPVMMADAPSGGGGSSGGGSGGAGGSTPGGGDQCKSMGNGLGSLLGKASQLMGGLGQMMGMAQGLMGAIAGGGIMNAIGQFANLGALSKLVPGLGNLAGIQGIVGSIGNLASGIAGGNFNIGTLTQGLGQIGGMISQIGQFANVGALGNTLTSMLGGPLNAMSNLTNMGGLLTNMGQLLPLTQALGGPSLTTADSPYAVASQLNILADTLSTADLSALAAEIDRVILLITTLMHLEDSGPEAANVPLQFPTVVDNQIAVVGGVRTVVNQLKGISIWLKASPGNQSTITDISQTLVFLQVFADSLGKYIAPKPEITDLQQRLYKLVDYLTPLNQFSAYINQVQSTAVDLNAFGGVTGYGNVANTLDGLNQVSSIFGTLGAIPGMSNILGAVPGLSGIVGNMTNLMGSLNGILPTNITSVLGSIAGMTNGLGSLMNGMGFGNIGSMIGSLGNLGGIGNILQGGLGSLLGNAGSLSGMLTGQLGGLLSNFGGLGSILGQGGLGSLAGSLGGLLGGGGMGGIMGKIGGMIGGEKGMLGMATKALSAIAGSFNVMQVKKNGCAGSALNNLGSDAMNKATGGSGSGGEGSSGSGGEGSSGGGGGSSGGGSSGSTGDDTDIFGAGNGPQSAEDFDKLAQQQGNSNSGSDTPLPPSRPSDQELQEYAKSTEDFADDKGSNEGLRGSYDPNGNAGSANGEVPYASTEREVQKLEQGQIAEMEQNAARTTNNGVDFAETEQDVQRLEQQQMREAGLSDEKASLRGSSVPRDEYDSNLGSGGGSNSGSNSGGSNSDLGEFEDSTEEKPSSSVKRLDKSESSSSSSDDDKWTSADQAKADKAEADQIRDMEKNTENSSKPSVKQMDSEGGGLRGSSVPRDEYDSSLGDSKSSSSKSDYDGDSPREKAAVKNNTYDTPSNDDSPREKAAINNNSKSSSDDEDSPREKAASSNNSKLDLTGGGDSPRERGAINNNSSTSYDGDSPREKAAINNNSSSSYDGDSPREKAASNNSNWTTSPSWNYDGDSPREKAASNNNSSSSYDGDSPRENAASNNNSSTSYDGDSPREKAAMNNNSSTSYDGDSPREKAASNNSTAEDLPGKGGDSTRNDPDYKAGTDQTAIREPNKLPANQEDLPNKNDSNNPYDKAPQETKSEQKPAALTEAEMKELEAQRDPEAVKKEKLDKQMADLEAEAERDAKAEREARIKAAQEKAAQQALEDKPKASADVEKPRSNSADPTDDYKDLSGKAKLSGSKERTEDVKGVVIHHTSGGGTADGVVGVLNQRGLSVNYVMERDGTLVKTLPDDRSGYHMLPGSRFPNSANQDLSNKNTVGIEVIAKNDADVTQAQVVAGQQFIKDMQAKYPNVGNNVYGHGELNPGHKEPTEGMKIVNAFRRGQRQ